MRLLFSGKGVPPRGTPFVLLRQLLFLALWCQQAQADPAADCPSTRTDELVRVSHVYDGDTVKLNDGRRLRFIGINTPETGRDDQPPGALAEQARAFLEALLNSRNQVLKLQLGEQRRDHYGRLLAHAFLPDGRNLAVQLLDSGLATTLVVPPNTRLSECYRQHESLARAAGRGLWGLPEYRTHQGAALNPQARGFHIVQGEVVEVRQARHGVWVDLAGPLVLHISRKDLVHFEPGFPRTLAGQTVEVRGWLKPDKHGLRMTLRHPASLTRVSDRDS